MKEKSSSILSGWNKISCAQVLKLAKNCKDKQFQVRVNIFLSRDLSDLNNSYIFSLSSSSSSSFFFFLWFFYLESLPQNKTKGCPSSKITNVKIQRLFEIILEKQQTSKSSLKDEWKEVTSV